MMEAAEPATLTYQKGESAGSKTPNTPIICKSPRREDDSCSICLGTFTDKCAAGSCLHNFCLGCLKEWAKRRCICPLCKKPFTKIYYDIKSETDYKEWTVSNPDWIDGSGYSPFPYDFSYNWFFLDRLLDIQPLNNMHNNFMNTYPTSAPSIARRERVTWQERRSPSNRFIIDTNNERAPPLADTRRRYRTQPALTLASRIEEELAKFLPASRIKFVLNKIIDLIKYYRIKGREFRQALRPYLGNRIYSFTHRLHSLVQAYDVGFNLSKQNFSPYYVNEPDDDHNGFEIESNNHIVDSEALYLSSTVAREENFLNDGSDFRNIHFSNSLQYESSNNNREIELQNDSQDLSSFLRGPSVSRLAREDENITRRLDEPGTSGISSNGSLFVNRESSESLDSDSDDSLINEVLKRKRTPKLIDIISGSKNENIGKLTWRKKISKLAEYSVYKPSKGCKKPKFDRTNASHIFSGTVNPQCCEYHNYCRGHPSPLRPSSHRTSSNDGNYRIHPSLLQFPRKKDLGNSNLSSDSDCNDEYIYREAENVRHTAMTKRACNLQSCSCSPALPDTVKKDHKSKVKTTSGAKSEISETEENSSVSNFLQKRDSSYLNRENVTRHNKNLKRSRNKIFSTLGSERISNPSTASQNRSSSSSSSSSSFSSFHDSSSSSDENYNKSNTCRGKRTKQTSEASDKESQDL